jgi:hypothetical protein
MAWAHGMHTCIMESGRCSPEGAATKVRCGVAMVLQPGPSCDELTSMRCMHALEACQSCRAPRFRPAPVRTHTQHDANDYHQEKAHGEITKGVEIITTALPWAALCGVHDACVLARCAHTGHGRIEAHIEAHTLSYRAPACMPCGARL